MHLPEPIPTTVHDETFAGVKLEAITMGLKTGIFGGGGKLTWNRFTGPGRLAIQTLFIAPLEGAESNAGAAATGGVAGAIIGGLTRG